MGRWLITAGKTWDEMRYTLLNEWSGSLEIDAPTSASSGDQVILWRRGKDGGVVALGEIDSICPKADPFRFIASKSSTSHRDGGSGSENSSVREERVANVTFEFFRLSNPISIGGLKEMRLESIVKASRRELGSSWRPACMPISLDEAQWNKLVNAMKDGSGHSKPAIEWVISEGSLISRTELHSCYGGNVGTISGASGKTANMFFFPRSLTSDRGGTPRWENEVLVAPGYGETGKYVSYENITLLTHLWRGIPLRVFEADGDNCVYIGEFVIDQKRPIERWVEGARESRSRKGKRAVKSAKIPLLRLKPIGELRIQIGKRAASIKAPRMDLSLSVAARSKADSSTGDSLSIDNESVDIARQLLGALNEDPSLREALAGSDYGYLLAEAVELQRRRSSLVRLRKVVDDPRSREQPEIYGELKNQAWIFGGRFIGEALRSELTTGDVLDIPLICGDGTLHVVELKQACVRKLVVPHRSHFIPGPKVHEAVCQANNYLRSLDEERATILAKHGIECRRASATVVIGHTKFVAEATATQTLEALRTYNSLLPRIEVITFDQLVEGAERALDFADRMRGSDSI